MEQNKTTMRLTLGVLVALIVGVVVGMYIPGGGDGSSLQGKLALKKDASATCQVYKTLKEAGILTPTLGTSARAAKVVKDCNAQYPGFMDINPTYTECKYMKASEKAGGTKKFSDLMKKQGILEANAIHCAKNYPWLWYNVSPSERECAIYREFDSQGILTRVVGGNNYGNLIVKCQIETRPVDRAEFVQAIFNVSGLSPATCPNIFPDINGSEYFYSALCALYKKGAIASFSDGSFDGGSNLSRAEAAQIITKTLGLALEEEVGGISSYYPDVDNAAWYYVPINLLAGVGIFDYDKATSDGKFHPNEFLIKRSMDQWVMNLSRINVVK